MKEYTVKVYDYKTEWYLDGKRHREDGPAIEYASGTKKWYLDEKLHREEGPAVEWISGTKEWYIKGERHRGDGPAIEYANGTNMWYLNGVKVSESDVMKSHKELTVKEIEDLLGYRVKVVK